MGMIRGIGSRNTILFVLFLSMLFFQAGCASVWEENGFTQKDAKGLQAAGIKPEEAIGWKAAGYTPEDTKAWKAAGFALNEAKVWERASLTPDDAKAWKVAGFTSDEAEVWKRAGLTPDDAKAWKVAGFTSDEAEGLMAVGLTPDDAKTWKVAGFTSDEAEAWKTNGFTKEKGKLWKDAGFTVYEANELGNSGISLEKAKFEKAKRVEKAHAERAEAAQWNSYSEGIKENLRFFSLSTPSEVKQFTEKYCKKGFATREGEGGAIATAPPENFNDDDGAHCYMLAGKVFQLLDTNEALYEGNEFLPRGVGNPTSLGNLSRSEDVLSKAIMQKFKSFGMLPQDKLYYISFGKGGRAGSSITAIVTVQGGFKYQSNGGLKIVPSLKVLKTAN